MSDDARMIDMAAQRASGASEDAGGAPLQGHVLVAAEDAMVRKVLVVYLKRQGFAVEAVEDGAGVTRALSQRSARFDVVVADVDSWSRELPRIRRIVDEMLDPPRIIALATDLPPERAEALRKAGVIVSFEKPFSWKALGEAVSRAAASRKR